jgi:hypothetical protein
MIVPRSLKTKGIIKFSSNANFILKKSYMTPVFLLKLVFRKLHPRTETGMALRVNPWPEC